MNVQQTIDWIPINNANYINGFPALSYDDIFIPLAWARVPASNAPSWTTYSTNLNSYTFWLNDFTDLATSEIVHWYKEWTNLEAHIHIITNWLDGTDRTVQFTFYYDWGDSSEVMDWEANFTAELTIPANTTDRTHLYLHLWMITWTTKRIGSLFKCRVKRIASTGTEPSNNPFVEMIGLHYMQDTLGSSTPGAK